jgi:hypothetical protein
MKKGILVALICFAGLMQCHAQYLKQIVSFSLTGYRAPENKTTIGYVRRITAQSFSLTDRALCFVIASDNGISVRHPQLIRVTDINANLIGYFVTDAGTVVADASAYISRVQRSYSVHTGTEVYNPRTDFVSVADVNHSYDTWGIGLLSISGVDTTLGRFSFPNGGDASSSIFSQWNFSAPVSGGYTNSDTGTITCCSGSIRATSVVVKSIPGLP